MNLTIKEVQHIAWLARLRLTPEEESRYAVQLSAILECAHRLAAVDTSGIPPTASVLPLTAPLREDVPHIPLPTEELLANAARTDARQFKVPPILDHNGSDTDGSTSGSSGIAGGHGQQ